MPCDKLSYTQDSYLKYFKISITDNSKAKKINSKAKKINRQRLKQTLLSTVDYLSENHEYIQSKK